jgi:hypothetical protein
MRFIGHLVGDLRFQSVVHLAVLFSAAHQSCENALPVIKPIRIIVKNGNLTLEGMVDTETDKNLVYIRANGVHGVFSVTNNLRVEKPPAGDE